MQWKNSSYNKRLEWKPLLVDVYGCLQQAEFFRWRGTSSALNWRVQLGEAGKCSHCNKLYNIQFLCWQYITFVVDTIPKKRSVQLKSVFFLNTVWESCKKLCNLLVISLYAAHISSFPTFVTWLGNPSSCKGQGTNKY